MKVSWVWKGILSRKKGSGRVTKRTALWEEGINTESVLQIHIQQRKEDQRDTLQSLGEHMKGNVVLKGEGNPRVKLSCMAEKLKKKGDRKEHL